MALRRRASRPRKRAPRRPRGSAGSAIAPREVCFLLGRAGEVLHAELSTSPLALPDSRARWEAIWHHRAALDAVVHSHPLGPHAFSLEDQTTMDALDAALGRPLRYAVLSPRGLVCRGAPLDAAAFWVPLLRLASGMDTE